MEAVGVAVSFRIRPFTDDVPRVTALESVIWSVLPLELTNSLGVAMVIGSIPALPAPSVIEPDCNEIAPDISSPPASTVIEVGAMTVNPVKLIVPALVRDIDLVATMF